MSLLNAISSMFQDVENYHDVQTVEHECRTGQLMSLLGKSLGLDDTTCELLNDVGAIHDIGKLVIPKNILQKSEKLTFLERRLIELHPVIGYEFISNIKHPHAERAGVIILAHHERYDGSGYPRGLKGEDIPFEAGICSVCDVYDALREIRPYCGKKSHEEAFSIMYDTGLYHQFKPALLDALKEISNEIQTLYSV